MDYLRTLGSAAVSTLVQKSGLNLPFTLVTKVASFENVWNLFDGTKRDDGISVSIFEYNFKATLPLARNAVRKLRTIRHPDVLKFIDAVETDTIIYIMTERVQPLTSVLPAWISRSVTQREDWLLWGLHRVSVALAFVNDACASTHGNLRVDSCFISPSGEWKLGGFELLSSPKDDAAVLYTMSSLIPEASAWSSPEVKKLGYSVLKSHDVAAADAYGLGLLFHAVFNPNHGPAATSLPPHPHPPPSSRGSIPVSVFSSFKKLLNPDPKFRMSPKQFLAVGMEEMAGEGSGFFTSNRLVKVCMGLDNFSLATDADKSAFLRTLKESASTFPAEFATCRVLPSLVTALEFGGASAATILPLLLQLGKNVSPDEYPSVILAPLIKLFANPDRGTRMALLDHLSEYADRLDKKSVSDKIWPHIQTGFSDTVAVIREATVKAIILLSPRFNERILNNDLLRYLAKMQTDPEASIRTNTCILIGRLGPSLGYNTKRKVLVPAFTRALKDNFVHARVAGLMAFMATIECFDAEELATKVIPNISSALVDNEKLVRDQAFKAVELFVRKLESHAATMPTTIISDGPTLPGSLTSSLPTQATLVSSAAGAAGALAGWAISSLGKKLATADMQSTMGSAPVGEPGTSVETGVGPSFSSTPPSFMTTSALPPPTGPVQLTSPRIKGLQLGANRMPGIAASAALAAQLAEEIAAEGADTNPWGTDDLIDINADQDDWSAFETAPVAEPKSAFVASHRFEETGLENGTVSPQQSGEASGGIVPEVSDIDPWGSALQNGDVSLHSDPWKGIESGKTGPNVDPWSTPRLSYPNLHTNTAKPSTPRNTLPTSTSPRSSSSPSPASARPTTIGMSKEEKAAEMARRKEERKQRIAQLKEQKKTANTSKG